MSYNLTVLLVAMLVAALVIGALIRFFTRSFKMYMNVTRTSWLLVVYGGVLVLAMPMSYYIHQANAIVHSEVSFDELEREYQEFNQTVNDGNLEQLDSSYIKEEWEFTYSDKEVIVRLDNDEYFTGRVFISRKDSHDGLIEATLYRSKSFTERGQLLIDFSDQLPHLSLALSGNQLKIIKPPPVTFNFASFKKEFPITQFTGEGWWGDGSSTYWGDSILYLKIPEELQVANPQDLFIRYIEE